VRSQQGLENGNEVGLVYEKKREEERKRKTHETCRKFFV